MNEDDRQAAFSLVYYPAVGRRGTPEDVLRHFGTTDGRSLGLTTLRQAIGDRDAKDLEAAVTLCTVFGFDREHLPLLIELESADWHYLHEDVVTMLAELRTPEVVDSLVHATQWIPEYLDFDDTRALARKAIWGLGGIPGPEAERALTSLLADKDERVGKWARKQLDRRRGTAQ
jgi:hypothetical protein